MRRIVLAICCIIVGALSLSAQDTLEQAAQYYDNKEYDKAVPMFQRLAQGGDAYAQCFLGVCNYFGLGTTKDYIQAAYWYEKAADCGISAAQCGLGSCYYFGQGVTQDYAKAVYWYRKAAEQDNTDAQGNLANCYYHGLGVQQDYTQAAKWYQKAAEKGDANAQFGIGVCYHFGQGVAEDHYQAVTWYRKSAAQGYANAQTNLGHCYQYGEGVNKDLFEAIKWYKLAADQGNKEALKRYNAIYANSTIDDFLEAAEGNGTQPKEEKKQPIAQKKPTKQSTKNVEPKREQTVVQKSETPAADRSIDTDIPVTGVKQDNTFAVIIGNENYQSVAKVPYAANDAKIFAEYCKRTLGLPEENVAVYTDATYGKMLGALQRISNIADAYDGNISIIFYYAGHGIPDDASREAFILPVDADGTIKESCLLLSRLYSSLARLNARRVTAFLDACFSGAERGDGMLASARGVAIKPKQNTIDGNVVVFTAVTGDQTAFPYKPSEHGMFTYYLLKKLKESRGNVSLGELSDYITTNVKQRSIVVNNKLQTPEVISSDRLSTTWRTLPLR